MPDAHKVGEKNLNFDSFQAPYVKLNKTKNNIRTN